MNFLKKLGTVALQVVGIASGIMPLARTATAANPSATLVVDKLEQGFNAIVTVEQAFAAAFGTDVAKGSDKLKAATPFVAQLIQQSDLLIGKHPKDESKFAAAVAQMTSAMADILSSYGA